MVANPIGKEDNKSQKIQKESVQSNQVKQSESLKVIPTCACPGYDDCVSNCFFEHLRIKTKPKIC